MADDRVYRASTTAPVNIAVIKYWGKRDPTLNLPTNSSLSVTLSQSDLRTHTTASTSTSFSGSSSDSLLLNNASQSLETPRSLACLRSLRALRSEMEEKDASLPTLSKWPLRIVSENNFPTAAGLASSAAGFAALVRAIADLYQLKQSPEELSLIARQGSGSACRSLLGGYVAWDAGTLADGSDSKARLVAPKSHWPEMRALILVVSNERKSISSTAGMQATVATSPLFQMRARDVVPGRMKDMEKAIRERDFQTFAKITTRESNGFHACCLDTEPPIRYLNDVSWGAIKLVEAINKVAENVVAAYTFDAGPNAVVYYLEESRGFVEGALKRILYDKQGWKAENIPMVELGLPKSATQVLETGVSHVIMTRIGDGPVSVYEHLVDESGSPVKG